MSADRENLAQKKSTSDGNVSEQQSQGLQRRATTDSSTPKPPNINKYLNTSRGAKPGGYSPSATRKAMDLLSPKVFTTWQHVRNKSLSNSSLNSGSISPVLGCLQGQSKLNLTDFGW